MKNTFLLIGVLILTVISIGSAQVIWPPGSPNWLKEIRGDTLVINDYFDMTADVSLPLPIVLLLTDV